MPVDRRLRRLGALAFALLPLLTPGCGLAAAIAVPLITDAIDGDNDDGGDPTILDVRNDAASLDAIVAVHVARVDGTHAPYSYVVNEPPGDGKSLRNIFDAGPHWVRVVYASGWRSRARAITVVKDDTVTISFLHAAADLAAMAGTWFGATQAAGGAPHTYALTLDASGQAGARTVDGVADAATGTLAETSEGVYRVSWNDGTVVALVSDGSHTHAGLLGDDGLAGALQKGASAPLPTGVDADVVGSWAGTQVRFTGATLTPSDVDAANATVSAQQHWDGTDGAGDGTNGVSPLLVTVPAYLTYGGDAESDTAVALDQSMWLSADRTFAFVRLTPSAPGVFPDAGIFQILDLAP